MKLALKDKPFGVISIIIMAVVFVCNFFISDNNLLWVFLTGGGEVIDHLGVSFDTIFTQHQIYRLLTYGYTQTAFWHIGANAVALWFLSSYLERKFGTLKFALIFAIGLVIAGLGIVFVFDDFQYGASPAIFTWLGILICWGIGDKSIFAKYRQQRGFGYLVGYLFASNIIGIPTLVFHVIGFAVGMIIGLVTRNSLRKKILD